MKFNKVHSSLTVAMNFQQFLFAEENLQRSNRTEFTVAAFEVKIFISVSNFSFLLVIYIDPLWRVILIVDLCVT